MSVIHEFWQCFLDHAEAIVRKGDPDRAAMDTVLEALQRVDHRLFYHIGHHDTGRDLIISAEGHADLVDTFREIMKAKPELPTWGCLGVIEADHLFGQRNLKVFPEDLTGDILYKALLDGDNLFLPRDIDFALVFPSQSEAVRFIETADFEGCEASYEPYDGAPGFTWQVEVTRFMHATHQAITQFERELEESAAFYGGRTDGWGWFQQEGD